MRLWCDDMGAESRRLCLGHRMAKAAVCSNLGANGTRGAKDPGREKKAETVNRHNDDLRVDCPGAQPADGRRVLFS